MVQLTVDDVLNYESENMINKTEQNQDSSKLSCYKKIKPSDPPHDLSNDWLRHARERDNMVKRLRYRERRLTDAITIRFQLLKVTGWVFGFLSIWGYLEYKQIPL
ncbi:hypothetical protein CDIK_1927 [Cucumispora dikerogammari]|nr:hypothetical protein CDIK_1927 [Cucumispora dikerogammari]